MPLASTLRMAALALFWGSGFLWIKLALTHGLTPAQITIARCALGTAVLLLLARRSGQRLPRGRTIWLHLAVAALFCNALPFALFALGEQRVDSGLAGVLNATTPLWSLLIGLALGTDRGTHPVRLVGLVLGFAGTVLIFAPWQHAGLFSGPALALLAAAASYAVAFAYMARHLAVREAAPAMSAAQLLAATAWTTLALPVAGPLRPDPVGLLAVTALGVLGTGLTFHLNYRLIADEGATTAATVGYLLPVVSVALGALVLDEHLGARTLTGMTIVLAGVALTRVRGTTPTPTTGPAAPSAARPTTTPATTPAAPPAAGPAGPPTARPVTGPAVPPATTPDTGTAVPSATTPSALPPAPSAAPPTAAPATKPVTGTAIPAATRPDAGTAVPSATTPATPPPSAAPPTPAPAARRAVPPVTGPAVPAAEPAGPAGPSAVPSDAAPTARPATTPAVTPRRTAAPPLPGPVGRCGDSRPAVRPPGPGRTPSSAPPR